MLALIMTLMLVPTAAFAETIQNQPSEVVPEQPEWNLDISKSKTATQLVNDESTITLSLPSAQEKLASDIVFVLDKSTSTDLEEQALKLLTELKNEVETKKANVKVGVVIFNKIANVTAELTNLDNDGYEKIETAIKAKIESGTNTHAGLLAGKEMLDEDTSVDANRKYLLFVSDGVTYQFCKDDDYTKAYTRSFSGTLNNDGVNQCGTLSEVNVQYDNVNETIPFENIEGWMTNIGNRIGTDNDKSDWDYEYTAQAPTDSNKLLLSKENVSNVEKALYSTESVYNSIKHKKGYKCYSVLAKNTYPWGTAFMNRLAGGSTVDFASIGNEILYAVGAGSTVEDKMGSNFDLVLGTFGMTVGGKALASKTDVNVTYFGDDANTLSENNYRFKVEYDSDNDMFTWTINENVSNFAPVQLTYKVKLVNKSTVSGTYTPHTNEYAILKPISSDRKTGKEQAFNKPTVSYTVSGGNGGHDHYYPTATPIPPIIVNPPKTGDMTIWQSILHFFGIM